MSSKLASPQMVLNSRMLYTSWIPADPQAAARLLPPALKPAANHAIYMNQYVVDSAEQTTGFGAYSLTYLGLDVADNPAPDGVTPGRFFTHYFNSSETVRQYARERGVPATPGRTTLEVSGGVVTATTYVDDRPIIRTRAEVGDTADLTLAGHLRYITRVGDRLVSGNYPYVGELVTQFRVTAIEFLDPTHPVYALRPATPLNVVAGSSFYAPRDSFVYPGGEHDMGPANPHERRDAGAERPQAELAAV
ncbi:MAG TPA: acetoacetate decarboxylase family protein [Longimicrobium sp.]|nr:acetoacetate decarboxylase family protein [Longimicrobium sp.]